MNSLHLFILSSLFFIVASPLRAQNHFTLEDTAGNLAVFTVEEFTDNSKEKIKITRESGTPASAESTSTIENTAEYSTYRDICKVLIQQHWGTDIVFTSQETQFDSQIFKAYEAWKIKKIENTIRLLNVNEPAGILKLSSNTILLLNQKKAKEEIDAIVEQKRVACESSKTAAKRKTGAELSIAESDVKKKEDEYLKSKKEQEMIEGSLCSNYNNQSYLKRLCEKHIKELEIHNVSFTISDNFIYRITIEGVVDGEELTISNSEWSLSLKSREGQTMSTVLDGQKYTFCFKDVFTYQSYPTTGSFSYYVKDEEFSLKPGGEKVLSKRSLDEYLSINISSDFLGINTGNSNNLLTTDFNAFLPLNVLQKKRLRWFNHASIRLGFTVLNGANGSNDFKNINSTKSNRLFIDVFDLLRYQNIYLDIYQSFLGLEIKKINTVFNFAGGINFYRSGLRMVEETPQLDVVKQFNVWSTAPFFKLYAQYRPDLKFGADFQFAIKRLTMNNLSNDIPLIYLSNGIEKEHPELIIPLKKNKATIFSFELDLYGQIGGKAGVFARMGLDAVGFRFNENVFPRITVGYSTNLDAYINSVKKR